jgi:hypothetical protein
MVSELKEELVDNKLLHEMKEIACMENFLKQSSELDKVSPNYKRILLKFFNRINKSFDKIAEGLECRHSQKL